MNTYIVTYSPGGMIHDRKDPEVTSKKVRDVSVFGAGNTVVKSENIKACDILSIVRIP